MLNGVGITSVYLRSTASVSKSVVVSRTSPEIISGKCVCSSSPALKLARRVLSSLVLLLKLSREWIFLGEGVRFLFYGTFYPQVTTFSTVVTLHVVFSHLHCCHS